MKKTGTILITLAAALSATGLAAQTPAPTPAPSPTPAATPAPGPVDAATALYDQGRYLQASDMLAAAAFKPDGTRGDDDALQMWEQVSPTVTNELDLAVLDRAGYRAVVDPDWARRVAAAVPHDAIDEIVSRARTTRIVILNEAHDSPRDRAFGLQVARALRPLGYTLFAAETFDNSAPKTPGFSATDRLKQEGFVRRSTGYYTRDPVFAAYVREALAAGYRPVSYEQTIKQGLLKGGIDARERAEAANLAAILAADPTAKILIHVGHSHVAEAPIKDGRGTKIEWMASRLKRLTGIDPLTIDQTDLTDLWPSSRPAHALAAARIGERDAVLFEGDRPLVLGQYAGAVDLQVVHPARAYRDGRPTWLVTLGGKPLAIPRDLLPATGHRLIQAFAAGAPADAVPLDQVVVTAGQPVPLLMVPPGEVRFATEP